MSSSLSWFLLFWLVFCCVHRSYATVRCNVSSNAADNATYSDLQDALNNCRLAGDSDIALAVNGTHNITGLVIPNDIQYLTLYGGTGFANGTFFVGWGIYLDPLQYDPSDIAFFNITFDLGGSNSTGLFYPQLTNVNITFSGCTFLNYNGTALIQQEACIDDVLFTFVDNYVEILGSLLYLQGIAGYDIERNYMPNSGDNVGENQAFLFLKPNWVSTRPKYYNSNRHWRVFECRGVPCDYSLPAQDGMDTAYYFKCDHGTTKCFALAETQKHKTCPIGDYSIYDQETNQVVNITHDFNPLCRIYTPCTCNPVRVRNTTTGDTFQLFMGNVIFPNGQILPCVPQPGAEFVPLPIDIQIISMTDAMTGLTYDDPTQILTPDVNGTYYLFGQGEILPHTCPCNGSNDTGRNIYEFPCEYVVVGVNASESALETDILQQTNSLANYTVDELIPSFCEEGIMQCCVPPDQFGVVYKVNCSLSPTEWQPALYPNGSGVDRFTPQNAQYYDCTYLSNCQYDNSTPGIGYNCTHFRCGLSPCRLGVSYPSWHRCYSVLGMGNASTDCNNFNVSVNDSLCNFLRSGCDIYYIGNGYLKPGYAFNWTVLDPKDNTTIVLSETCSFEVDRCVYFNDTRCQCSSCDLNTCQLDPPISPVYQENTLACYATYNVTNVTLCLNASLPPYDDNCANARANCTPQSFFCYGEMCVIPGNDYGLECALPPVPACVNATALGWTLDCSATGNVSTDDCLLNGLRVGDNLVCTPGQCWWQGVPLPPSVFVVCNGTSDNTSLPSSFCLNATLNHLACRDYTPQCVDFSATCGPPSSAYWNSPACANQNATSTDPQCLFTRGQCFQYYDVASGYVYNGTFLPGYPPAGYNASVNTTAALNYWNAWVPLYPNVTSNINCVFNIDQCTFDLSLNDTRCNCEYSNPSAFHVLQYPTNLTLAVDVVVTSVPLSNTSWVVPKLPHVIQGRKLPLADLNCTTALWYDCNCPPVYNDETQLNLCLPSNESWPFCNWTIITVADCRADPACQLPPPSGDYPLYIFGAPMVCHLPQNIMTCDCSAYLVQLEAPPQNGSVTVFFANMPWMTSEFQTINNSACYHNNARVYQQTNLTLIRESSIDPVPFYDQFSLCRDTWVQQNQYEIGTQADCAENLPKTPYRRECEAGCFRDMLAPTSEGDYECIVDAATDTDTPGFGVNIFHSLYQVVQAINDNGVCSRTRTVLIRYNNKFYMEPQDIQGKVNGDELVLFFGGALDNFTFVSLDGAVVVGSGFQISSVIGRLTFVGIFFMHPGDNNDPIFDCHPYKDERVGVLLFRNCIFDGQGVRGAGIINSARLYDLDFSYNLVINWNFFALRVLNSYRVIYRHNTIEACQGQCNEFHCAMMYRIDGNTFVNSRGASSLDGSVINLIRATDSHTCCGSTAFTGTFNQLPPPNSTVGRLIGDVWSFQHYQSVNLDDCAPWENTPPHFLDFAGNYTRVINVSEQMRCTVTENTHIADLTAPDFDDTFILISGGLITVNDIYDNAVLKAQYGLSFIYTPNIGLPVDQQNLALQNPLVRPSLYRSTAPNVPSGNDFQGIAILTGSGGLSWLTFTNEWTCNFPCSPQMVAMFVAKNLTCQVNNNFDTETMPYYGPGIPRYGYYQYHNISDGAAYCVDFQTDWERPWHEECTPDYEYPDPNGFMPRVYVTAYNGSVFYYDNVTVAHNVWIIGNNTEGWCTLPRYKPVSRGPGNNMRVGRFYMQDMVWQLSRSRLGSNLWQTGDPPPFDVRWMRVDLDGNNVIPVTTSFALQASIGALDEVILDNSEEDTALPPPSNGTFFFWNCSVQNFTTFTERPVKPQHNRLNHVKLHHWPWTSGIDVTFTQQYNVNSTACVIGNRFENIDRTAVAIRYAVNLTFIDNTGVNISGRSEGVSGGLYFQGNPYYSNVSGDSAEYPPGVSFWRIERNNFTQQKPVLVEFTAHKANLVRVVMMEVRDLPINATLCIKHNTMLNMPIAVRFTNFPQSILATCLTPPNQVFFPDVLRFLRAVANESQCTNETMFDPYFGFVGTFHSIEYA